MTSQRRSRCLSSSSMPSMETINEIGEDLYSLQQNYPTNMPNKRESDSLPVAGCKRKLTEEPTDSDSIAVKKELGRIFDKPNQSLERKKERLDIGNSMYNGTGHINQPISTRDQRHVTLKPSQDNRQSAPTGAYYRPMSGYEYTYPVRDQQHNTEMQSSYGNLNSPTKSSFCCPFPEQCLTVVQANDKDANTPVKSWINTNEMTKKSKNPLDCNTHTTVTNRYLEQQVKCLPVSRDNRNRCPCRGIRVNDSQHDKSESAQVEKCRAKDQDHRKSEMLYELHQKLQDYHSDFLKLQNSHNNLKKMSLLLALLGIILNACLGSILITTLVQFKLSSVSETSEEGGSSYLSGVDTRSIEEKVFCVSCNRTKEKWSAIFTKDDNGRCCLQDIASLVENLVLYEEKRENHLESRLNKKINNGMQNILLDTASFNGSIESAFFSHLEKNSRLINTLLTRKRSAVHMSGKVSVKQHHLKWEQEFPTLDHSRKLYTGEPNHKILVTSGGVYFVYCCVRFNQGNCQNGQSIGYDLMMGSGQTHFHIAKVQHPCVNGSTPDTDLVFQQVVSIPADLAGGSDGVLHIRIKGGHTLVSNKHKHSFGLFEI